MSRVAVVTREGASVDLDCPAGTRLMRVLRDADLDIAGTCGGMASCGSCHVYVLEGGAALPAPGEDEADMLAALADVVEVRPESRLSCQIDGGDFTALSLAIAPQF